MAVVPGSGMGNEWGGMKVGTTWSPQGRREVAKAESWRVGQSSRRATSDRHRNVLSLANIVITDDVANGTQVGWEIWEAWRECRRILSLFLQPT